MAGQRQIGVLLLAMGTPEYPTYWSIRRFLSEFLSDRRVIELNPLIWQPILQGIILTVRPKKISRLYQRIWDQQNNESPLIVFTRHQTEKLQKRFSKNQIQIYWAMRYGQPSIQKQINYMVQIGCTHILTLPLYPQYSATTTATANDVVFKSIMKLRNQPSVRVLGSFADHSGYIQALKEKFLKECHATSANPQRIIISFHGLPQSYVAAGDPYLGECERTANALRQALGKNAEEMPAAYQSRFGPNRWLEPDIATLIKGFPKQGVYKIAVITPGFMADCLETIEEVGSLYKEMFLEAGGKEFTRISCLNDSDEAIDFLESLLRQELQGWL